jgi:hypothetical protein
VVAGRRIHLRQLHDPLAHPRLIDLRRADDSPAFRKEAGLFCVAASQFDLEITDRMFQAWGKPRQEEQATLKSPKGELDEAP